MTDGFVPDEAAVAEQAAAWRRRTEVAPDGQPVDEDMYARGRRLMNEAFPDLDAEIEEDMIEATVQRLRVYDAAKRRYLQEQAGDQPPFDAGTLAEILARPAEPPYRIEGLMPSDSSLLLVAQRKVGKTTFILSLARALLTGEHFLGRFPTQRIQGKVGVLNYEVGGQQVARWADRAHVDPDRLFVVNLRGRRNPLAHPQDRADLAALLKAHNVETLIVDVFGRAYSGANQNDNGEVGAWLVDLDRFARGEVGARDLILTAHAGWQGERARGASALEDWADSIVMLVKSEKDDTRYMSAIGRDVEVAEDALILEDGHLMLTGSGNRIEARKAAKMSELVPLAIQAVEDAGELTAAGLEKQWRAEEVAFQKGDGGLALNVAEMRGYLKRSKGSGNAKPYRRTELNLTAELITPTTPQPPQGRSTDYPNHPIGGGGVNQVINWDEALALNNVFPINGAGSRPC